MDVFFWTQWLIRPIIIIIIVIIIITITITITIINVADVRAAVAAFLFLSGCIALCRCTFIYCLWQINLIRSDYIRVREAEVDLICAFALILLLIKKP